MCINSRPSRRPSVKVLNQNGSVQLGENQGNRQLFISVILLCEGYALLIKVLFIVNNDLYSKLRQHTYNYYEVEVESKFILNV